MNSNKQKHYGDGVSLHQPPVKRGIWAFPYGHSDWFFCWHQVEKRLPKKYIINSMLTGTTYDPDDKFKEMSDEDVAAWWKEKEILTQKILKTLHPSKFWWGGVFYSHINVHGGVSYRDWYLWDDVKKWAKIAGKHVFDIERGSDKKVLFYKYSKDHLEIFIPNYK